MSDYKLLLGAAIRAMGILWDGLLKSVRLFHVSATASYAILIIAIAVGLVRGGVLAFGRIIGDEHAARLRAARLARSVSPLIFLLALVWFSAHGLGH